MCAVREPAVAYSSQVIRCLNPDIQLLQATPQGAMASGGRRGFLAPC